MGNCVNKKKIFNPGAVLDRVIAGSGPEDECLLYKLANFKKGVGDMFYLAIFSFSISGSTSGDVFFWPLIFFSISGSTGGGVHGDPGSERGPSGGRRFQGGGEADQEPAGRVDVQRGG